MPAAKVKKAGQDFWTPEKEKRLAELWVNDEMTGAMIADVIGAKSRLAVLLKARRLGLPARRNYRGRIEWTAEMEAVLRKWWPESVQTAFIAKEIGSGVTVSAVSNKANRMGLPPRVSIRPAVRRPDRRKDKKKVYKSRPTLAPVIEDEPEHERPDPLLLQIADLDATTCRFPIGEVGKPGFGFCGAKVEDGFPYCGFHNARAADRAATLRSNRKAAKKEKPELKKQASEFKAWRASR